VVTTTAGRGRRYGLQAAVLALEGGAKASYLYRHLIS
jgi:hypothetical protein